MVHHNYGTEYMHFGIEADFFLYRLVQLLHTKSKIYTAFTVGLLERRLCKFFGFSILSIAGWLSRFNLS